MWILIIWTELYKNLLYLKTWWECTRPRTGLHHCCWRLWWESGLSCWKLMGMILLLPMRTGLSVFVWWLITNSTNRSSNNAMFSGIKLRPFYRRLFLKSHFLGLVCQMWLALTGWWCSAAKSSPPWSLELSMRSVWEIFRPTQTTWRVWDEPSNSYRLLASCFGFDEDQKRSLLKLSQAAQGLLCWGLW